VLLGACDEYKTPTQWVEGCARDLFTRDAGYPEVWPLWRKMARGALFDYDRPRGGGLRRCGFSVGAKTKPDRGGVTENSFSFEASASDRADAMIAGLGGCRRTKGTSR